MFWVKLGSSQAILILCIVSNVCVYNCIEKNMKLSIHFVPDNIVPFSSFRFMKQKTVVQLFLWSLI